jgi:hypothetical protein
VAQNAGMSPAEYPAGRFTLLGFERFEQPGGDLTVYIESDGQSWLDTRTLSADPTPIRPLVVRLAAADTARNRLYLGRPCQYLAAEQLRSCNPTYWAEARFAPEIIDGYMAALDLAVRKSGAPRLTLIGYSGGGAVAALVAARRDDVTLLVTIAGTLDHRTWTRDAGVSPLDVSLNPPDFAGRLRSVRQIHFVGERDRKVPATVAESYMAQLGDTRRARLVRLAGYDHECCWDEGWRGLLDQYVQNAAALP